MGRPADNAISTVTQPLVLGWEYGEDQLLVEFDGDGRAVKVDVYDWRDRTLWKRFRGWLGW
jgi:hypothetical protein